MAAEQAFSTAAPTVCCIVPPDILEHISKSDQVSDPVREGAQHTLSQIEKIHKFRQASLAHNAESDNLASLVSDATAVREPRLHRRIYDCKGRNALPFDLDDDGRLDNIPGWPRFKGTLLFDEGHDDSTLTDPKAKNLAEHFKYTYDFYHQVFGRDSIDNKGRKLVGCVRYDDDAGPGFFNAVFIGLLTAYGDGDEEVFRSFTDILDIAAHEITHGVTEATAELPYEYQSGALNESISDVFGAMIKQWSKNPKQESRSADWLVGRGLFLVPDARALRDMANPGTAHGANEILGPDTQPRDMSGYFESKDPLPTNDFGGVHRFSGIPNRAFYLVATTLGGYSWEKAGKIWYNTLLDPALHGVNTRTAFKTFADLTVKYAEEFGPEAVAAVNSAWTAVKVYPWTQNWPIRP